MDMAINDAEVWVLLDFEQQPDEGMHMAKLPLLTPNQVD
jgi:hypothetical protein